MRGVLLVAGIIVILLADVALVLGGARLVKAVGREIGAAGKPQARLAPQVKPIRIGDKATTQRDFRSRVLDFNIRTMVDAYTQVGLHDGKWDDPALRLLRGYAATFAQVTDRPSSEALLADAKRALDAGCADPLVLYCCGVAFDRTGDHVAAEQLAARALAGLQKSRYPHIRAAFAAERLAKLEGFLGKPAAAEWKAARALLLQAATDGSYRKGEERVLLSHLTEYVQDMPAAEREGLYQDLRAAKEVDPYVAAVFGGDVEREAAWDARSGDWASQVTERQWQGFREHLDKAKQLLIEAWKAHPECPEALAEMVQISSGLDGYNSMTRLWFDRCVTAEGDPQEAYNNLLWFMRPRWGGSHEMMYDFGVQCLKTGRFDTEAPLWFLGALERITDDLDGDKKYWQRPETKTSLSTLFDGYAKSSALPEVEKQRFRLLHAGAEWYLGNYEQARTLFEGVTSDAGADEFEGFYGVSPGVARGESELFSGTGGAEALRAQKLLGEKRWADAAQAYGSVLGQQGISGPARALAEERRAAAQWYLDLASGNWVKLQPPPDFAGWVVRSGDWHVAEDGTITGFSDKYGCCILMRDADIGVRMEFKGDMELVESPDKVYANTGVMFAVTGPSERDEKWDWDYCEFVAYERRGEVMLRHTKEPNYEDSQPKIVPADVPSRNTFLVRMWDDTVTTYLNGKPIHQNAVVHREASPGRAGVSINSICRVPGTIVRFRNLEVRRLLKRPEDL